MIQASVEGEELKSSNEPLQRAERESSMDLMNDCKKLTIHFLRKGDIAKKVTVEIQYNPKEDTVDIVANDLVAEMKLDANEYVNALIAIIEQSLMTDYNLIALRDKDLADAKSVISALCEEVENCDYLVKIYVFILIRNILKCSHHPCL
jgi:hypothetical protein